MSLWGFLNSEFLSTSVLLATGVLAFSTYFLQKRYEVKDAATILLNEIRIAESTISNIRSTDNVTELSIILSSNSWNKYSHLFARRLDQDELHQISEFYKKCELAENHRRFWLDVQNEGIKAKARHMQASLIDLAMDSINTEGPQEYHRKRELLIKVTNEETYTFNPTAPLKNLFSHIASIDAVTTSTTGTKLKKLSNSQ